MKYYYYILCVYLYLKEQGIKFILFSETNVSNLMTQTRFFHDSNEYL